MEVMNNTRRPKDGDSRPTSKNSARQHSMIDARSSNPPGYAQDPPETDRQPPTEHHVRLPEPLKDLYIVDIRGMSQKIEMGASLKKIQQEQGKPAHAIVFITCAESEKLLKKSTFKHSKNTRKHRGASLFAYNLNSNGVTVLDQTYPLTQNGQ
jgi:hypothetical protein